MKSLKKSVTVEVKATHFEVLNKMLGDYVRSERIARKNQWVHHFKHGTMMQSYYSVVGVKVRGKTYYGPAHNFSATTDKYIYKWCGKGRKEREVEILSGKARMIAGTDDWPQPWGISCQPLFGRRNRKA